jgi:D-tyrosyl-tRNA(Tyr) deacylase
MQVLLQRVSEASVTVDHVVVGNIGQGLVVLVCAEHGDVNTTAVRMLDKILKLRIFPDESGKMNRSVQEIKGALLIVSQFTLAADTSKGTRPSFGRAAAPEQARLFYDGFVALARQTGLDVQTGIFAADMKVALINDGPVTIPIVIAPTDHSEYHSESRTSNAKH